MSNETYLDRMYIEREEVDTRAHALNTFILSTKFDELAPEDRDLLVMQLTAMAEYLRILDTRIERAEEALV